MTTQGERQEEEVMTMGTGRKLQQAQERNAQTPTQRDWESHHVTFHLKFEFFLVIITSHHIIITSRHVSDR